MGERVHSGTLRDLIHIERAGAPILHDPIRLDGAIAEQLASPATAAGAVAIATLILVAPDAATRLDALRAALAGSDAQAGASCWNKLLLARIIARDGATARAAILAALPVLRGARPIPRVWNC
jgi:urease accessory protein